MNYFANPYTPGTQWHKILEVMRDLKWHCAKCELPGSQPAKSIQKLRLDGWEFEKVGSNWEKRYYCAICDAVTSQRRLVSLVRSGALRDRAAMPTAVRERVINHYGNRDELLGYAPTGRAIEIDHRVPQVRWKTEEENVDISITTADIERRFMLLVREHNLLKSRSCEKCARTDIRQPLLGIAYFYRGDARYDDSLGCEGCGWHNPKVWKDELNRVLKNCLQDTRNH